MFVTYFTVTYSVHIMLNVSMPLRLVSLILNFHIHSSEPNFVMYNILNFNTFDN